MKRLLTLVASLTFCTQAFCQNQISVQGNDGQAFLFTIINNSVDPCVELSDFLFTYYTETTSVSSTITYNGKDYKVVSIGDFAFMNTGLTSLVLPSTITSIGNYAFEECSELLSIDMPGVKNIGDYAFYGCTNLESVTNANSVTNIGISAFDECTELQSIDMSAVKKIGDYAFYNCASLESVTISNPVVGGNAFYGTNNLKTINLTKDSKSVYKNDFSYSDLLETINVETGNEDFVSIDGVLYKSDTTEMLWFPVGKKSLTIEISTQTLLDLENVCKYQNPKSIVVKEGNKNFVVVNGALYNADTTKLLCCSSSVKGAFELGTKIDSISQLAFIGCDSITSIKIPASVSFIADGAFSNCANLEKIEVDANNPNFVSVDGVLLDASKTKLICCPPKKEGSFTIPETVEAIGAYALCNCTLLTDVVIPQAVSYIGDCAFVSCCGLKKVELTSNLKYLGYAAFADCENLESVVLSGHIDEIGNFVFEDCINLKTVKIQGELKSLSLGMFQFCYGLESVELPESLETIGSQAFMYCEKLTEINIPSNMKTIGNYAFFDCESLESMVLSKSVTSVGSLAFYMCINLTIYCEAQGKPSSWDNNWNASYCPIKWNYGHTDVEESDMAENVVNIYAFNNTIVVDNANADVFVYDVMGKLVAKDMSNDQRVEMHIQRAGVYIVKAGNATQRVVVR